MAGAPSPMGDALVGHMVDLAAFGNDAVRRIMRILARADVDILRRIAAAIEKLPASTFTVARLYNVLASARGLNAELFQAVSKQIRLDMGELAVHEVELQAKLISFGSTRPATAVSREQAYSAGSEAPFRGRLMSDWASGIGQRRMQRIQDSLAMGFVEGRTVDEMVRTLRGTRAQGYKDGIINASNREVSAIVRTAVGHYAQAAREVLFEQNADLIDELEWVATLDSRTSEICMIRDGKRYTVDHEPIGHELPWLGGPGQAHWNCRSSCVPRLKLASELGLTGSADRASVDGPVSAATTYASWIKRQPAARQDEVLGKSRGKLMRQGKYTLDRFYNNEGRFLTLEQLRARDAKTFERLGL